MAQPGGEGEWGLGWFPYLLEELYSRPVEKRWVSEDSQCGHGGRGGILEVGPLGTEAYKRGAGHAPQEHSL